MDRPLNLAALPREILEMILTEHIRMAKVYVVDCWSPDAQSRKPIYRQKTPAVPRPQPRYVINSRNVSSILRTCKVIFQTFKQIQSRDEDFLIRNLTFHYDDGLYASAYNMIQIGRKTVSLNRLAKICGNMCTALALQEIHTVYHDLKEMTVLYSATIHEDKPTLSTFAKEFDQLIQVCSQRQIRLCIFVDISSKSKYQAEMKAIVEGIVTTIYSMKETTKTDLAFFRRLFKKLFQCELSAPDIQWPPGKPIKSYVNERICWEDFEES